MLSLIRHSKIIAVQSSMLITLLLREKRIHKLHVITKIQGGPFSKQITKMPTSERLDSTAESSSDREVLDRPITTHRRVMNKDQGKPIGESRTPKMQASTVAELRERPTL